MGFYEIASNSEGGISAAKSSIAACRLVEVNAHITSASLPKLLLSFEGRTLLFNLLKLVFD